MTHAQPYYVTMSKSETGSPPAKPTAPMVIEDLMADGRGSLWINQKGRGREPAAGKGLT